ncbi:MAG: hypothetical protein IKO85_03940 [Bacteroidaceae bacterium]|nr:hypothetical protein [Bacteroidaceae bacterium]
MKKLFFLAAVATMTLASCMNDEFIGTENSPTVANTETDAILFGFNVQNATRADIYGNAAANLLGSNFYVTGTKGSESATYPSDNLVFDNYLVHYVENTAGKTESNTANWEYVGVDPTAVPNLNTIADDHFIKLSSLSAQTIKYWDYSEDQYDFLAFSTGKYTPVLYTKTVPPTKVSNETTKTIGVTAMKYGDALDGSAVAYSFDLPSIDALKDAYISDITTVEQANYGKEVILKFKNLGSKVRIALYETVPGYSVQAGSVKFYTVDNDAVKLGQTGFVAPTTDATLISESSNSFATEGFIDVYFPNLGTNNKTPINDNYNKAAATVTAGAGETTKTFGTLATDRYVGKDSYEAVGNNYLGRSLPYATFAGDKDAAYYKTVFPVSTSYPLTLRIDYTLVATDGSGETINVYGAKAVVPSKFTVWQPNYAYTYVFKISDNTNGWTDDDKTTPGLFPITFDAVVAEFTDASGEQTTITTVSTPTITTYQQGHNTKTDGTFDASSIANEYNHTGEKLYVQVMDNNLSPAVLVGTVDQSTLPLLNAAQAPKYHASLLYKLDNDNATEAMVMDALENRDAVIGDYNADVKGRNGITLTYNANINNAVTSIANGVDDNAITVTAGQAAEIAIGNLSAGTYAYVYDYSWTSPSKWSSSTPYSDKTEVTVFEPITPASSSAIGSKDKYYSLAPSALDGIAASLTDVTVDDAHLYFSKTKNGTGTTTYSYISVVNKIGTTLPKGVVVVAKDNANIIEVNGDATPVPGTFYFDKYFSNNGSYAVKVIKVV